MEAIGVDTKSLGICLIGCGRAGMIHARNFGGKVPGARMTAVADVMEAAARSAADELGISRYSTDYRDFLDDPAIGAMVVVAPTNLHCGIVLDCAAHGKHVFCEKPMAMDTGECQRMITACRDNGVTLQIGFMRRHDVNFLQARKLVEEGAIGELVLVKSHTRGPSKPQTWMYDLKKSNGILAEVNSHDIDAVRWFAGSEVERLYAVGGNFRNPEIREQYPDYYDNVVMTGVFRNGVQFEIDGSAYVRYGYDSHMELIGTKGMLHVGRSRGDYVELTTPEQGTSFPFVSSWTTLFTEAYLREDIAFADAVVHGTVPAVTGLDGLMAVGIVEAGNRSIRTGEAVMLKTEEI
jgi:myo-inositol 2-dehydrogenase / D-chiro-inositol 1-dehydrogenase